MSRSRAISRSQAGGEVYYRRSLRQRCQRIKRPAGMTISPACPARGIKGDGIDFPFRTLLKRAPSAPSGQTQACNPLPEPLLTIQHSGIYSINHNRAPHPSACRVCALSTWPGSAMRISARFAHTNIVAPTQAGCAGGVGGDGLQRGRTPVCVPPTRAAPSRLASSCVTDSSRFSFAVFGDIPRLQRRRIFRHSRAPARYPTA